MKKKPTTNNLIKITPLTTLLMKKKELVKK